MKKVAERKLNAIGNINSYFCFVNDDTNLEKMRNQLQLTASISEISRIQRADQLLKKSKEHDEKVKLAPAAIKKLEQHGGDAATHRFTKRFHSPKMEHGNPNLII